MIGLPAPKPCESCPYRRDVPSGVWAEEEYAKLPTYDGETWEQNIRLFQCHQNERESGRARLCAGWVACHDGQELLALRLTRQLTDEDRQTAMRYTTTVPVFDSGAEAAAHGMREAETPSEEAVLLMKKIGRQRPDVGYR